MFSKLNFVIIFSILQSIWLAHLPSSSLFFSRLAPSASALEIKCFPLSRMNRSSSKTRSTRKSPSKPISLLLLPSLWNLAMFWFCLLLFCNRSGLDLGNDENIPNLIGKVSHFRKTSLSSLIVRPPISFSFLLSYSSSIIPACFLLPKAYTNVDLFTSTSFLVPLCRYTTLIHLDL